MAKVILSADGQSLDMPDEVASDDTKLRQSLATFYPQLATAKIERTTIDGELRVTVSKQAGPKGARRRAATGVEFVDALIAAPEHVNPAVLLWNELSRGDKEPDELPLSQTILLAEAIEQATAAGSAEISQATGIFDALRAARPVAGLSVPEGF